MYLLYSISIFIEDGERPDQIALNLYGDPGLDWVVRMVGEITNMPNDWPLSSHSNSMSLCGEVWMVRVGMNSIRVLSNYRS